MHHDPDWIDPAELKRRAAERGPEERPIVVGGRPRIRRTPGGVAIATPTNFVLRDNYFVRP